MYYLAVDSITQNFVLTQVSTVRVKYQGSVMGWVFCFLIYDAT